MTIKRENTKKRRYKILYADLHSKSGSHWHEYLGTFETYVQAREYAEKHLHDDAWDIRKV